MGHLCGFAPSRSSPRCWPPTLDPARWRAPRTSCATGCGSRAGRIRQQSGPPGTGRGQRHAGRRDRGDRPAAGVDPGPGAADRRRTPAVGGGGGRRQAVPRSRGAGRGSPGARRPVRRGLRPGRAQPAGPADGSLRRLPAGCGAAGCPGLPVHVPVPALRTPARPGALRGRRGLALVRVQARASFDFRRPPRSCPTGSRCRLRWRNRAPSGTGASAPASRSGASLAPLRDGRRLSAHGPADRRMDRFFALAGDVTRTGDALLGAGAGRAAQRLEPLRREPAARGGAPARRVAAALELSLAARAELVATRYADAVRSATTPTGAFVTIEDEGRSSLRLDLTRPLGAQSEARRSATPSGTHTPRLRGRQLPAPRLLASVASPSGRGQPEKAKGPPGRGGRQRLLSRTTAWLVSGRGCSRRPGSGRRTDRPRRRRCARRTGVGSAEREGDAAEVDADRRSKPLAKLSGMTSAADSSPPTALPLKYLLDRGSRRR